MEKRLSDQLRDQVRASYQAVASSFDHSRRSPWPEFEAFPNHFPRLGRKLKVLDVGCGNGRLFGSLKPWAMDYVGIDNSPALLEKARARFPEAAFQLGDMTHLSLSDDGFDMVFAIASFHHIPDHRLRQRGVAEMHRVLKRDGVLILTVWNLFQPRFLGAWVRSLLSFLTHLGSKYEWNDLRKPWGNRRYYHAFLPRELLRHFNPHEWKIEDFYFTRNGKRVSFLRSFNLCLVARKLNGKNG